MTFFDHITGGNNHFTRCRMCNVVQSNATQNTHAERGNDLTGINDRVHCQTNGRTAIWLRNDRILRNVNETACQITGVSGFQSRIGQTLTGTVCRVEVLVHGQTFFKVRDNRCFDNLARRLGHQTAHTAELTHLRRRTTGTGVRHHVDGVHLLLTTGFLVEFNSLNTGHHFVGDLVSRFTPGINNLVVLFALSDQTVIVLLFIFLGQSFCIGNDFRLGIRNDHVILTKRNTGATSMSKTELHHAVTEDHCLFLTAMTVNQIDHLGDVLLGHFLIADIERNIGVLRQQLTEDQTARRCIKDFRYRIAFRIN